MTMRRALLFAVLAVAAIFACDVTPLDPDQTVGWIGLVVIVDGDTATTAGPAPSSKAPSSSAPFHRSVEQRALNPDSGGDSGQADDVVNPALEAPQPTSSTALSPEQWESIRVTIREGDRVVWSRSGSSGETLYTTALDTGSYSVALEGLVGGMTDYFGLASNVRVRGGDTTTATVNFNNFKTSPAQFGGPTAAIDLSVSFGPVSNAQYYLVDLDTDPDFTNPTTQNVTQTNTLITVSTAGNYHVRVRAGHEWAAAGHPGNTESVEVIADTVGNSSGSAFDLGTGVAANGTYGNLNILPSDDIDWFKLHLSPGVMLSAKANAHNIGSSLDPLIVLYSDNMTPLASEAGDDGIGAFRVTYDAVHYLRVTGGSGPPPVAPGSSEQASAPGDIGHYELVVLVEDAPASESTSEITAAPTTIVADGQSTSTITVQVRDDAGEALTIGGDKVKLETTLGTLSLDGWTTDNGDGTYTATLTAPTSAGTATITGILNGLAMADQETVTFKAGPADPTTSTIVADPTSILADGTSTSTITVQLKDQYGNDLLTGGDVVELASSAGALSAVIDNGDGTYTATLTASTAAETATITGTLNSAAITDGATVSFTLTIGPADPATSLITAQPTTILADGSSTSTITVQLRDENGTNLIVGGDQVELATTAGTLGDVTDNNDGTYTAILTAPLATGTATITGTLNGTGMSDDATVTFSEDVADAGTSLITAVPTTIPADGSSTATITVRLRDQNGNNVTSGGDLVELAATDGTLSTVTDNGDGTHTAMLTSSITAGIVTITGTLNGAAMTDDATVVFSAGEVPSGATSLISANPTNLPADGSSTSTITVQLKDQYGNDLTGGGDNVELFTAAGTLSGVTDNGDGTYTAALTAPTRSGSATITGRVNAADIADDEVITLTTVVATVVVTPAGASIAGGTTTFTAEVRDAQDNPLPLHSVVWNSLNPNVATIDPSTGEATAVASGQVTIAATSDGVAGYGLLTVAVPGATAVNLWHMTSSGTTSSLNDIWGVSESEIYAVGGSGAALRYSGTQWNTAGIGTTIGLSGIWGVSYSDVFVVGGNELIRYDGSEWIQLNSGLTTNFHDVWAASPQDVYLAGLNGTVAYYNGTGWTSMATGTTTYLSGIWGTATSDAYAVGDDATVLHYDGTAWSPITGVTTGRVHGVWGSSNSSVYVATDGGVVVHYDGTSWTPMPTGAGNDLYAIWGSSDSDLYVAGTGGRLVHYDGSLWHEIQLGITDHLAAVWGTFSGDVFVVGQGGVMIQGHRGATVSAEPTSATLNSIGEQVQLTALAEDAGGDPISGVTYSWSSDNESVATVDVNGLVTAAGNGTANIAATAPGGAAASVPVTVQQTAASVAVTPAGASISGVGSTYDFDVEVRDANGNVIASPSVTWTSLNPSIATIDGATGNATAVANGQVSLEAGVDGLKGYSLLTVADPALSPVNLWAEETVTSSGAFYGVWAADSNHAYTVGISGAIQNYDGSSWTSFEFDAQWRQDVWGTDPTNVYAGGLEILHWDGSSWSSSYSPPNWINGIWGSAPDNIYAVGDGGAISHYDGSQWSTIASGTNVILRDVWGASASDIFVVGEGGTILHWDGTSWSPMTSGTTQLLFAVWGFSGNDVFAGGEGGVILRFDGTDWTQVPNTTGFTRPYALWGASPQDVYAVGGSGGPSFMMQFDGTDWNLIEHRLLYTFFDTYGMAGGDLFAVGAGDPYPAILRGYRGATVTVTPPTANLTAVNQTIQLSAAALDASSATISGVTYSWASDNEAVATVDADGLVTAVGNGTANITATAPGGAAATVPVTVQQTAASVAVTPAGASISGVGSTFDFDVEVRDGNGNLIPNPAVIWSTLNSDVATVDPSTGQATAVTSGQVTIAATADDVTGYTLLTVSQPGATPVNLWSEDVSPTTANLWGIWGTSASDVWVAAGAGPDLFLHFDGAGWSAVGPTTNAMASVWGASTDNVWAVGGIGLITHYEGSAWSILADRPTTTNLNSVWGTAPDNIHAVGDGGTILYYDGTSWSSITSPTTESLRGVWGVSSSEIWAVGSNGTILRNDGDAWTSATSPTTDHLFAVWGTAPNDVWVVGGGGTILHYDGSAWTQATSPTVQNLYGAWGAAPNDVFAVALDGNLLHYDGAAWTSVSSGIATTLRGIWGASNGHVFAIGNTGTILRGSRGATVTVTPADPTLNAIDAQIQLTASAEDAGGDQVSGVAYNWSSDNESVATVDADGLVTAVANGTANITATAAGGAAGSTTVTVQQTAASVVVTPSGASISGAGSTFDFDFEARDGNGYLIPSAAVTWSVLNSDVAATDQSGVVTAQRDGQVTLQADVDGTLGFALVTVSASGAAAVNLWKAETSPTADPYWGVWGSTPDDIWAVGQISNAVAHYDGTGWSTITSPTSQTLTAVWGSAPNDVWAVGWNGSEVLNWDGSAWSGVASPSSNWMRDIWGSAPNDIWAVGDAGTIVHYDGQSGWSMVESPVTVNLHSIWGSAGDNIWAVGDDGTIIHFDGAAWSDIGSPWSYQLLGVWGTAPDDVWVVGWTNGVVLHYNGSGWGEESATGFLLGTWGSAADDVWGVGYGGTIVHRNGTSWTDETTGLTSFEFRDLWGTAASDVWIVGAGGTILRGYRGATVTVTPASQTLVGINNQFQLAASAEDASGNPIAGATFDWSSDNEAVAFVDASGLVTSVAAGTANITATAPGGAGGSAQIEVQAWNLLIQTATTGDTLDLDGYIALMDGTDSRLIGLTDAVTFSNLTAGDHTIELTDVAVNCTVSGENPRTVSTGTTSITFTLTCEPAYFDHIAFNSYREGNPEIYVMNSDGSGTRLKLTDHLEGDYAPTWSPRGTKIAFYSYRNGSAPDIYVMNIDGTGLSRITTTGAYNPAWSPDGTRIAYDCGYENEICLMDPDGTNVEQLTNNTSADYDPAWSPDGSRLAFASNRDQSGGEIYVMNADGTGVTRLTYSLAARWNRAPAWSPDGARITFTCEPDQGNYDICVMDANGSNLERLTTDPAWDDYPGWSADGTKITFDSNRDIYDNNLYVMNSDGTGLQRLSDVPQEERNAAWSPVRERG